MFCCHNNGGDKRLLRCTRALWERHRHGRNVAWLDGAFVIDTIDWRVSPFCHSKVHWLDLIGCRWFVALVSFLLLLLPLPVDKEFPTFLMCFRAQQVCPCLPTCVHYRHMNIEIFFRCGHKVPGDGYQWNQRGRQRRFFSLLFFLSPQQFPCHGYYNRWIYIREFIVLMLQFVCEYERERDRILEGSHSCITDIDFMCLWQGDTPFLCSGCVHITPHIYQRCWESGLFGANDGFNRK